MTPRRFTVVESRQAMLVTADNLDEVAAWCGGRLAYVPIMGDGVRVPNMGVVAIGDYLVTDGARWWDMSAEEFGRVSATWSEEARPHRWRLDDIIDGWEHWSCHCGCGARSSDRWHETYWPPATRVQQIAVDADEFERQSAGRKETT